MKANTVQKSEHLDENNSEYPAIVISIPVKYRRRPTNRGLSQSIDEKSIPIKRDQSRRSTSCDPVSRKNLLFSPNPAKQAAKTPQKKIKNSPVSNHANQLKKTIKCDLKKGIFSEKQNIYPQKPLKPEGPLNQKLVPNPTKQVRKYWRMSI